jgi:hypothetical protein
MVLIFPCHLLGNTPDPPATPKITGIAEGDPAPYSGVLLNSLAAAELFAEKDYSIEECRLKIQLAVQKETLRMQLLLDSTQVSLEAMDKKYAAIIDIKDNEIEKLSKIALEKNDYSMWWLAGGVIAGIAVSLGVLYGVKNIE